MSKHTRRIDHWQDPDAPKPTSRKASASVFVRNDEGAVLLLRRTDNDLWTIPTGGIKKGETVAQCAVRECEEETGLKVEIIGLVGIFSSPEHVIVYMHGDDVNEVRQPINVCLRARVVGGVVKPDPKEAQEVRWVAPGDLGDYSVHPALQRRIEIGLGDQEPYIE
ncbi:NUDIX domain-containing protein [Nonomuraea sp. NPDC052265]|uniref:NUDIX domain-containing protein n=1 Tax=Nonomuraea sp. NPDC052265 TaxID=3364374 RepID=UPI0037CB18BC